MRDSDISHYEHTHIYHYSGGRAEQRTMYVVMLTIAMMIVEIVAGWIFNSMALLADGWHMSTHAAALGISWVAFVLARRHSLDRRFAFGTWKIEILGGFISAILLGLVGVVMAVVSVERLFHPVSIHFNEAILVAIVGLVVNVLSMIMLHDHGHDHGHKHDHEHHDKSHSTSLNLRAAYIHVMADALTSVLAIAALLGGKYLQWNWLDPAMGIVGAVLILRWTVGLLSDTGVILLDRETGDELATKIRAMLETDGKARCSDLHVWKVGQDKYSCIAALVVQERQPLSHYKDLLKGLKNLVHVTIEVDDYRPPAVPPPAAKT